jgi:hypothetical protein
MFNLDGLNNLHDQDDLCSYDLKDIYDLDDLDKLNDFYDLDDSDDLYDRGDLCREFLGQAWLKEEKKERAPNICLMTERFNDVSTTAIQPQHSQETL